MSEPLWPMIFCSLSLFRIALTSLPLTTGPKQLPCLLAQRADLVVCYSLASIRRFSLVALGQSFHLLCNRQRRSIWYSRMFKDSRQPRIRSRIHRVVLLPLGQQVLPMLIRLAQAIQRRRPQLMRFLVSRLPQTIRQSRTTLDSRLPSLELKQLILGRWNSCQSKPPLWISPGLGSFPLQQLGQRDRTQPFTYGTWTWMSRTTIRARAISSIVLVSIVSLSIS